MFFFLAYFTLYNRLQFHPSQQKWFKCILFNSWVILHCVYVPQLSYPFICWWTSRLFPCPGYYKQCYDEHWGTCDVAVLTWDEIYDKTWVKQVNWVVVVLVVQSPSYVQLFVTPWTAACQASLSFIISQSLLKLMSIESAMPSNRLILCHLFLLLSSVFPSIRVFFNELVPLLKWPKYWSFSISPFNESLGLISFRMDSLISLLFIITSS